LISRARLDTALALLVLLASVRPASAQSDLSGSWSARNTESLAEADPVDFTGLPLNDEGRTKALAYSESQLGMTEHQCQGWPPLYLVQGPFGMQISSTTDPVSGATIALTIAGWEDRAPTTIWMDARPHPSRNAPHGRGGFATGTWEGDTLVVYITHMKAGLIRRNGAPSSDEATLTLRFLRHGDILTVLAVLDDPIYLSEPLRVSKGFQRDGGTVLAVGPPCIAGYEGGNGEGNVPHYVPEKNPFIDEMAQRYHIPREAVLGGVATIYPEYRKKMKDAYVRPEK
jgi:hypothetical protein